MVDPEVTEIDIQVDPRYAMKIQQQVRDYFTEQGNLSSLAATVDYRGRKQHHWEAGIESPIT